MSKIICFRHAQASYLAKNYDELSSHGEQQAEQLGNYLLQNDFQFDQLYVGPLVRQQKTLEIVGEVYAREGRSLGDPITLAALKEHHGPRAMRMAYDELVQTDEVLKAWEAKIQAQPEQIKRYRLLMFQHFMHYWVQGQIVVPGVESWATFRKEVRAAVQHILAQTGKGQTIALFTSGGTIAAIVAEALEMQEETKIAAMNFAIRNTAMTQFWYSKEQFTLHSFNELAHLPAEMETFV
ncbi:MAG: histidine phosphatase family protein [Bacteroidota bacterium]